MLIRNVAKRERNDREKNVISRGIKRITQISRRELISRIFLHVKPEKEDNDDQIFLAKLTLANNSDEDTLYMHCV